MDYLSDKTVLEIISLSEARLAAIPQNQTQRQKLGSILGQSTAEELALRNSLDKLNQHQAVQLTAMMYAGQYLVDTVGHDDHQDDEEVGEQQRPLEGFEDVYRGHLHGFQHHNADTLISMCEEKASVLHRYLKAALERHSR